ncbi:cell division protein SepF [Mycoplasmatota bacterium]|nr:cell division protein SepF [Mycoplasmatota bacterium]
MSIIKKLLGYPVDDKELKEEYSKSEDIEQKDKEAKDKIIFEKMLDTSKAQELADKLIEGYPLVINFEDLGVHESNQMIAFLSGVSYTLQGINLQMTKKIFIFSKSENLEDGSIMHFYNQYREET